MTLFGIGFVARKGKGVAARNFVSSKLQTHVSLIEPVREILYSVLWKIFAPLGLVGLFGGRK